MQDKVEDAWMELQDECGLEHTANMKQCLRVTISRYMATPDAAQLSIQEENGVCLGRDLGLFSSLSLSHYFLFLKLLSSSFSSYVSGIKGVFLIFFLQVPFLRTSRPGPLPSHLHRLEIALQKVSQHLHLSPITTTVSITLHLWSYLSLSWQSELCSQYL